MITRSCVARAQCARTNFFARSRNLRARARCAHARVRDPCAIHARISSTVETFRNKTSRPVESRNLGAPAPVHIAAAHIPAARVPVEPENSVEPQMLPEPVSGSKTKVFAKQLDDSMF